MKMEVYNSVHHSSVVLQTMYLSPQFTDVNLKAVDSQKSFLAHKSVLVAATPYFEAMFCGSFKESKAAEVDIDEVEGDSLEMIVKFIYCGTISIDNMETAKSLLAAAHLMQIPDVVKYCTDYFYKNISPENCLFLWLFSKKYSDDLDVQRILKFATESFLSVSLNEQFLQLSEADLFEFLTSVEITSTDIESQKLRAVVDWIEHKEEDRSSSISALIRTLRLDLIQEKLLIDTITAKCFKRDDLLFITSTLTEKCYGPHLFVTSNILQCFDIAQFNVFSKEVTSIKIPEKTGNLIGIWKSRLIIADGFEICLYDLKDQTKTTVGVFEFELSKINDSEVHGDYLYLMTSCNVYQVLLTNGTILRRFGRPTEPDFYFEAITSSTSYVHVISYGCYSNILRVDNYHPSDNTWNDSSIECKFDTNHQGGAAIVFGNSLFYLGYPSYKYNLKDHQWNELHAQATINELPVTSLTTKNNRIFGVQRSNIIEFLPLEEGQARVLLCHCDLPARYSYYSLFSH